jgi:hypothetical protein
MIEKNEILFFLKKRLEKTNLIKVASWLLNNSLEVKEEKLKFEL